MIKVPLLFVLLFGLLIQTVQALTLEEIKTSLSSDEHAPQAVQHIHFGPMKDGRNLYVTMKMVNNSLAVQSAPVGPDKFIIRMGRALVIKSVFIADAMMICAHFPKAACSKINEYIDIVGKSPSVRQTPFLEEVFPDLKEEAKSTRSDDKLYTASLLAGPASVPGLATLHEIGHAALHHFDNSEGRYSLIQEGEADGFAVYVAKLGGASPEGLALPFLLDAVSENVSGNMPVNHPPALCRAIVTTQNGSNWILENKKVILTPSENKSRDLLTTKMFDEVLSSPELKLLDADTTKQCGEYIASFVDGVKKASLLVDKNTNIDSTTPGQQ